MGRLLGADEGGLVVEAVTLVAGNGMAVAVEGLGCAIFLHEKRPS